MIQRNTNEELASRLKTQWFREQYMDNRVVDSGTVVVRPIGRLPEEPQPEQTPVARLAVESLIASNKSLIEINDRLTERLRQEYDSRLALLDRLSTLEREVLRLREENERFWEVELQNRHVLGGSDGY